MGHFQSKERNCDHINLALMLGESFIFENLKIAPNVG